MARLFSRSSVTALGLLLGACGTPATGPSPETSAQPPSEESDTTSGIAAVPSIPEPGPEPASPPIPVPEPANLLGSGPANLRELFGEPSFIRRDPPAQLWHYQTAACILDLFLYDDGTETYTVTHMDFRETTQSTADKEHCMRQIILEMTTRHSG